MTVRVMKAERMRMSGMPLGPKVWRAVESLAALGEDKE